MIGRGADKPLTLLGPTLDVGSPMPDVTLADGKLEPIQLGSLKGKIIVLSVVPSIDTRVCETQTHKVSDLIAQMPPGVSSWQSTRSTGCTRTGRCPRRPARRSCCSRWRSASGPGGRS